MRKLRTRRKFDIHLLNEKLQNDNANLIGEYNNLTQHSIITFKCKCGIIDEKPFRNIVSYGGAFCKKCININQLNKTKLTYNSEKRINGINNRTEKNRLSNEEILKRLKEKFNTIEILNINEYNNATSKLNFICNDCNIQFTRTFRSLIQFGCQKCKLKNIIEPKINTKIEINKETEFIKNCENKHPKAFNYSKVKFINKDTNIILICNTCNNEILIRPKVILKRKISLTSCEDCLSNNKLLLIKDKIKDNWIINDLSSYNKKLDSIDAYCKECNFKIHYKINDILDTGCMNCYDNNKRGQSNKLNNEIILERYKKVWNNKYDYSKTNYINQITPITIICKKHGEFSIYPRYHEKGSGCPKCYPTTELYLLDFLKNYYPTIIPQFKLDSCKNKIHLPFDYCIPEIKTIIELDGEQHFKPVANWKSNYEQLERDIYKMNKAHQEGYKIIRITQMDVFKYKEKWLEDNLLPEIESTDRNHIFISSDDTIYDRHIETFEKSN